MPVPNKVHGYLLESYRAAINNFFFAIGSHIFFSPCLRKCRGLWSIWIHETISPGMAKVRGRPAAWPAEASVPREQSAGAAYRACVRLPHKNPPRLGNAEL